MLYNPEAFLNFGSLSDIAKGLRWGLVPSFTKKGEKPDHYRMVRIGHLHTSGKSHAVKSTICLWVLHGNSEI